MSELFRQLPKVDVLMKDSRFSEYPKPLTRYAIRRVVSEVRADIVEGRLETVPDIAPLVLARLEKMCRPSLVPVINATGIVIHTNLGRAPWASSAVNHGMRVAGSYCNLEMDLASGKRGGRLAGVEELLSYLTGAEAALVVNNCAAAVLLSLTAVALGREVIVSRGELVEIGGSFRIPNVVESGGAFLKEVGTTNRTRLSDYESGINENTAALLKVHRSNFKILGFTEEVSRADFVSLGKKHKIVTVEDLGSGNLDPKRDEPTVKDVVDGGVDLVLFSGDKLLGGPQAGIIVGSAEHIAKLNVHPWYRALRVDKVTLAALEQTLIEHTMERPVQVDTLVGRDEKGLKEAATAAASAWKEAGINAQVLEDVGFVGGGALPDHSLRSTVVAIGHSQPDRIMTQLRTGSPSIVARVSQSELRFDFRTVFDEDRSSLIERVAEVLSEG